MDDLKAVIQAGGQGTRLAPYSTVLPKALMPVGEDTVIDNLLRQFSDVGVKRVMITVSKFGPLIRSYCADGRRWGLDIEYVEESEPLGTIGPLSRMRDRLDGPFFVSNSDVFIDLSLQHVVDSHGEHPAPMTVVVTRQRVSIAYGVLEHAGGRVSTFREKPTQEYSVSTGIYLMEPEVLDHVPDSGPFGFDQLMFAMLGTGTPVNVYEHEGTWIDIGRIEDLRRAQEQAASALPGPQ
ncbi:sugar phosphate nucleotidyltransferase [Pseudonocardia sp. KRD291]|uniref:sugar phosphate nucleotidyltransferase n=1 Tax=Pseudonocardia sp. KRD291 TaxID=2792007 RepID=UPI001C49D848|nr:sugar phosphate nucleotidyltransferase [Pseudonocardia sp. KRD291]MBW0101544.1 NTP transferase domain-containing protein [Pseudonocardia sp. KRD291]